MSIISDGIKKELDDYIKDFLKTLRIKIIDLFDNINRIIWWTPKIWKDRDWDYAYLYKIIEYKLARMEDCIRNGYNVDSEKVAKNIKICRELLKRLAKDEYEHEFISEYYDKYPIDIENINESINNRQNKITKLDEKKYKWAIEDEENRRKYDIEYLFYLMKKYHRHWWD